ncbi:uncharacterized protein LOC117071441 [Trachypithecus francoisi]|uniref:uncharacterized protein LOC117071441 n=1 Tax=Trachypithecus francoisi TaxID=54180 RepID=UPI00141B96BB|nr:uncharacterized protein LOC117071441 [Trachypithecus francoisi]
MAPERYHSNVLELLTPPRTPCARLRTSAVRREASREAEFLTAAGGRAIITPVFSLLVVGVRWWKGTVKEAPGDELCLGRGRSHGQCDVDGARKNPERSQTHEAPLPARCEVPLFPPPEVAAAALSWSAVPEGACQRAEAPTRAPCVPHSAALRTTRMSRCLGLEPVTQPLRTRLQSNKYFTGQRCRPRVIRREVLSQSRRKLVPSTPFPSQTASHPVDPEGVFRLF